MHLIISNINVWNCKRVWESDISLLFSVYCKNSKYSDFVSCSLSFLPQVFPYKILYLYFIFLYLITCCGFFFECFIFFFLYLIGYYVCLQCVWQNYSLNTFALTSQTTVSFLIKLWKYRFSNNNTNYFEAHTLETKIEIKIIALLPEKSKNLLFLISTF